MQGSPYILQALRKVTLGGLICMYTMIVVIIDQTIELA